MPAFSVAEAVRQTLGQHFHASLAYIVSRITGRTGDPLLRSGVDDGAMRSLSEHARGEDLHAVDHAPQIDLQHAAPAIDMVPWTTAGRSAGVVHQDCDFAERRVGDIRKLLH